MDGLTSNLDCFRCDLSCFVGEPCAFQHMPTSAECVGCYYIRARTQIFFVNLAYGLGVGFIGNATPGGVIHSCAQSFYFGANSAIKNDDFVIPQSII